MSTTTTQPLEFGASRDAHYDDVTTSGDELNRNVFLIKEHVALFKASSNYDIYDPETGELIMCCREPGLGWITKAVRFTDYKRMTPFDVRITTPTGDPLLQVSRGFSLFLSNVRVNDGSGELLGGFKQKLFSIGGSFTVLNAANEPVCELKGKWSGWDFRFQSGGQELARVTKQWNGIGKELFTSADNYVLEIDNNVPPSSSLRKLILAAVMTIDLVLKE
jgi:uncharacterized protein YxjI